MDQSRAINALAPFIALAKSANSPRAAADLVTQATSAPNTYLFAELLQQKNIQALAGNEQYGSFLSLLQVFAWGTWEAYKGIYPFAIVPGIMSSTNRSKHHRRAYHHSRTTRPPSFAYSRSSVWPPRRAPHQTSPTPLFAAALTLAPLSTSSISSHRPSTATS